MFFRQVLHRDLGCASYVIADGGIAAIVDPKWDIDEYVAMAIQERFRIEHIFETHNHADHLSGRGRLCEETGAVIHVPNADAVEFDALPVLDGDTFEIGRVQIAALATPGHRPEHVSYLVSDTTRSPDPWLALTGDSLLIGDVARPDLAVRADEGARDLHGSLQRLLDMDDYVEVYPAHIGGSMCGGAGMSENPGSTIGFERRFNSLLAADDWEFARRLVADLQPQPPNFHHLVELNRGPLIRRAAEAVPLSSGSVAELLKRGATLIDGREPRAFCDRHIAGSISVTMANAAVGTRAAWILDPEDDYVVTAARDADARRMIRMLEAIGLRKVHGYLAGGLESWRTSGRHTATVDSIGLETLAQRLADECVVLLDVREDREWRTAHVKRAIHAPFYSLGDGVLPLLKDARDRPIAVACSVGNRSSLAISLLAREGFQQLIHVSGGIVELDRFGFELVVE